MESTGLRERTGQRVAEPRGRAVERRRLPARVGEDDPRDGGVGARFQRAVVGDGAAAGAELRRDGRPRRVGVDPREVVASHAGGQTGDDHRRHVDPAVAGDDGQVGRIGGQVPLAARRRHDEVGVLDDEVGPRRGAAAHEPRVGCGVPRAVGRRRRGDGEHLDAGAGERVAQGDVRARAAQLDEPDARSADGRTALAP